MVPVAESESDVEGVGEREVEAGRLVVVALMLIVDVSAGLDVGEGATAF